MLWCMSGSCSVRTDLLHARFCTSCAHRNHFLSTQPSRALGVHAARVRHHRHRNSAAVHARLGHGPHPHLLQPALAAGAGAGGGEGRECLFIVCTLICTHSGHGTMGSVYAGHRKGWLGHAGTRQWATLPSMPAASSRFNSQPRAVPWQGTRPPRQSTASPVPRHHYALGRHVRRLFQDHVAHALCRPGRMGGGRVGAAGLGGPIPRHTPHWPCTPGLSRAANCSTRNTGPPIMTGLLAPRRHPLASTCLFGAPESVGPTTTCSLKATLAAISCTGEQRRLSGGPPAHSAVRAPSPRAMPALRQAPRVCPPRARLVQPVPSHLLRKAVAHKQLGVFHLQALGRGR